MAILLGDIVKKITRDLEIKIKPPEPLLLSYDKKLGFLGRSLIQATLPHSQVDDNQYTRNNGNFSLSIINDKKIGIPYGIYPRIILCWLSTEIVKKKSREIILGKSLSEFMHNLEIRPTGGKNGTIQRVRDQMKRLFSSVITLTYEDNQKWYNKNFSITDESYFWWDKEKGFYKTDSPSIININEQFYEETIIKPVPIDMQALKVLKNSSLALDLYFWLTYRASYLKKQTSIPLNALFQQFGVGYKNDNKGKYEFKRSLKTQLSKIKAFYDDIKYTLSDKDDTLTLYPSYTHINKKIKL